MNAQDATDSVYISSLDDYQRAALATANRQGPHASLITGALGLAGEAGEAADIVKKVWAQGHDLDVEALEKELGDILWYVALTAHAINKNLSQIASGNIAKLRARYPNGFTADRSINRTVD